MTKCIAKSLPEKEVQSNPLFKTVFFSKNNLTVKLSDIRRDAKYDHHCFLFTISVDEKIVGEISILDETNLDKIAYQGNIGAEVYRGFNGQQYAERAITLLLPFCKKLGLSELLLTTDPGNGASQTICSNLNAKPIGVLAANNEYKEKVRYILADF